MSEPSPYPRARKRFGQHFLESAWVTRLVNLVEPTSGDTFLEIGPGRGALTRALAPRVGRVIAIEIDRDLADVLPERVPSNVTVIQGDFLATDLAAVLAGVLRDANPTAGAGDTNPSPIRVIGNLPYNISSPIL